MACLVSGSTCVNAVLIDYLTLISFWSLVLLESVACLLTFELLDSASFLDFVVFHVSLSACVRVAKINKVGPILFGIVFNFVILNMLTDSYTFQRCYFYSFCVRCSVDAHIDQHHYFGSCKCHSFVSRIMFRDTTSFHKNLDTLKVSFICLAFLFCTTGT